MASTVACKSDDCSLILHGRGSYVTAKLLKIFIYFLKC